MKNKIAFLFPGQGSQYAGLGLNVSKFYKKSNNYYKIAENILGFDIKKISFDKKSEKINSTNITQPAIFINSVIKNLILKEKNIIPKAVAGHSLGEFSALVSADVLTFEDALEIIKIRSEEMHAAGKVNPGSMAAVIGANKSQLDKLCNQKETVVVANYNSDNQVVISGTKSGINNAIEISKKIGVKRIIKLNVSGAFHSPLMKFAREKLKNIINNTTFKKPSIPIYQNVDSIPTMCQETIKHNLIKQLENSVQWSSTILNMKNDNYNYFLEVGPGKVLTNLNKKIINNSVNKSFKDVINYNNV